MLVRMQDQVKMLESSQLLHGWRLRVHMHKVHTIVNVFQRSKLEQESGKMSQSFESYMYGIVRMRMNIVRPSRK